MPGPLGCLSGARDRASPIQSVALPPIHQYSLKNIEEEKKCFHTYIRTIPSMLYFSLEQWLQSHKTLYFLIVLSIYELFRPLFYRVKYFSSSRQHTLFVLSAIFSISACTNMWLHNFYLNIYLKSHVYFSGQKQSIFLFFCVFFIGSKIIRTLGFNFKNMLCFSISRLDKQRFMKTRRRSWKGLLFKMIKRGDDTDSVLERH